MATTTGHTSQPAAAARPKAERCAFCWRPMSRTYLGPASWLRGTALCVMHADQAMSVPRPALQGPENDRPEDD